MNNARYIADVTIPDDVEIAAGTTFTKTWRVENSGTMPWPPPTTGWFSCGERR